MTVEIPAEYTPFVNSLIASGEFQSESAVIEHALRLLRSFQSADDRLRQDVLHGFEQIQRGECSPGDEVLDRLQQRAERLARGERP